MKKYVKQFCIRGLMWAWGGPVIMAIVWMALHWAGVVTSLTVDQAVLGIITLIFFGLFIVIWFIIYITVKLKVDKMNKTMGTRPNQ